MVGFFINMVMKSFKTFIVENKNPYWFRGPNKTVDLAVFRDHPEHGRQVLLIQRKQGTVEGGKFALPGGFINTSTPKGEVWKDEHDTETPHEAAVRETAEETGLQLNMKDHGHLIRPVGVYEGGGRDPRDNPEGWSKSHAFTVTIPHTQGDEVRGMDDAVGASWHSINNLPELAFDHGRILSDALTTSKGK
jgi:8-oxo-dGTP diphosphatase